MLNEIERDLIKRVRFCNISSGNNHSIKGWLWYEIAQEVLPLSREREVVSNSRYFEFDQVFSSLLGKEVEAVRLLSNELNLAIKKALEENPELTWRELGLPAWYWRSEIK